MKTWIFGGALCLAALAGLQSAQAEQPTALKLTPNLAGRIASPLRYRPENGDFVIRNGGEFFNRPLYGSHSTFRVDGGDKPEFLLYLPGHGGNLRLGLKTARGVKWLKDAADIETRYRPGELLYEIRDPAFGAGATVRVAVLAYADTEGLVLRAEVHRPAPGAEWIWAYGGITGKRGNRGGDIGTERVPISEYFQFRPDYAEGNALTVRGARFTVQAAGFAIAGAASGTVRQHAAAAEWWDDPAKLTAAHDGGTRPILAGEAKAADGAPLYLSLQRLPDAARLTNEPTAYRGGGKNSPVHHGERPRLAAFAPQDLAKRFADTEAAFERLRHSVRVETPDPYLDAAMGALNVGTDALWDDDTQSLMHGAIAWRTPYPGWRGAYALDEVGRHDLARRNFESWIACQNVSTIPETVPPPDETVNLSRNEPGLHSNGDLTNAHYDMNKVFFDALFRHLLWTGDTAYARRVWPAIVRHLAWEKRLFRRVYPEGLPLYESYADIWASDALFYSGAGTAYASAYNLYADRIAARLAPLAGADAAPYAREADAIATGLEKILWMPGRGAFAETRDLTGNRLLHRDYGLWTFYHVIDEGAADARRRWSMAEDLLTHLPALPIQGPGVPADRPYRMYSETDWMPYAWSVNNVVMDENSHTALALWQSGHDDDAYDVLKGAVLASLYMGINPGNLGMMNYLDVYRRESQRDFADSAGTLSRAMIEGLFGIRPDALAHEMTVAPGFPAGWDHAKLHHPDVDLAFRRDGETETWTVRRSVKLFRTLHFLLPVRRDGIAEITVNGKPASWRADPDAAGRPLLTLTTKAGPQAVLRIRWAGRPIDRTIPSGPQDGGFVRRTQGAFSWWAMRPHAPEKNPAPVTAFDWRAPRTGKLSPVDLTAAFNDRVSEIFRPGKYLAPRPQGVSLSLPTQGYSDWTQPLALPQIDDSGLRRVAAAAGDRLAMPDGVPFATPGAPDARNVVFVSQWNNYPKEMTIALAGRARHLYLMMAGSTNHQQSRMENGAVIVTYTDGTTAKLSLRNPESWWPIEADYFIDDYQFRVDAPLPARIDLKTGRVRLLDAQSFKGRGRAVAGGAATALQLPLDPAKELKSLTVEAVANDVVIGLMSATLERP